jgi:AcrR family transcriptional regulator
MPRETRSHGLIRKRSLTGAGDNATGARARRRPGRPATASRDDVLRLARELYLGGRRVDLTIVANRLGLGRTTIYRWFGSRDELLGEIIASELERLVAHHRALTKQRGPEGLLEVFDRLNRSLSNSEALRALLEQERDGALRMLTSSGGPVQPRAVACVQGLIEAEAAIGAYQPPLDTAALAYAIVRLAEAFIYNDVAIGIRGDWRRLHQVEAALLGVGASDGRGSPLTPPSADREPADAS